MKEGNMAKLDGKHEIWTVRYWRERLETETQEIYARRMEPGTLAKTPTRAVVRGEGRRLTSSIVWLTHVRGFILQVYTPRGMNRWSHAGTACVRYVPTWGRYTVWELEPPLSGCSPVKKINKQGKRRCACEPSGMAEEAGSFGIYGV